MAKLEMEIDFKSLREELAKYDFVEVVRCGDCEWYRIGRQTDYCELAGVDCKPDHFCSWGEKSVLRNQN